VLGFQSIKAKYSVRNVAFLFVR